MNEEGQAPPGYMWVDTPEGRQCRPYTVQTGDQPGLGNSIVTWAVATPELRDNEVWIPTLTGGFIAKTQS